MVSRVAVTIGTDQVAPAQPRALIVTIYGLYAREAGGWLPVAMLVRLLAQLGVDEPAVRSAISRLKRREILIPQRRGGTAGYALSDSAREIIREGDERIFSTTPPPLAQGWLLAVFSVPETERAKRHMLRSRLAALGFGTAAPGVWVAPANRRVATMATLRGLDVEPYVNLFRADYLAFGDLSVVVERWWDLDAVRRAYLEFVAGWRPVLARWRAKPGSDAAAFAVWVSALTSWRRLPYLDPGLPAELLPPDWPGGEARRLLGDLQRVLAGAAYAHADTVRAVGWLPARA